MKIIACKNCATRYRGRYCPYCGQKARTGRLNWKTLWDNLAYSITNMDRGIVFTLKELFSRPGYMMRDYLSGKRVKYFPPFSLLFVSATVFVILSTVVWPVGEDQEKEVKALKTEQFQAKTLEDQELIQEKIDSVSWWKEDGSFFDSFINQAEKGAEKFSISPRVAGFLEEKILLNPVVHSVFLLFSAALIAPLIFRRNGGRRYNYVEYLYIGAYMASQRFIIDIVLLPYEYYTVSYDLLVKAFLLKCIGYVWITGWNFKQLFGMRWRGAIWKTGLLIVSGFAVALFMVSLLAAIILLILAGLASLLK